MTIRRSFWSPRRTPDMEPTIDDLYRIGVIANIKQVIRLPKGMVRVLAEGLERAELLDFDTQRVRIAAAAESLFIYDPMPDGVAWTTMPPRTPGRPCSTISGPFPGLRPGRSEDQPGSADPDPGYRTWRSWWTRSASTCRSATSGSRAAGRRGPQGAL